MTVPKHLLLREKFNHDSQVRQYVSKKSRAENGCTEIPSNLMVRGAGWMWGSDAPRKFGWISCAADGWAKEVGPAASAAESARVLSMEVNCRKGDLLVGYLKSYDRAMGTVAVTAQQLGNKTRFATAAPTIIDAFDPQTRESVLAIKRISGLVEANRGTWKVMFTPGTPRDRSEVDGSKAGGANNVTTRLAVCAKEKFKLMLVGCT